jgi:Sec-independent protein translocase protein TatA
MFGFSFAELIIVLLVAFIFIKPQDLPEIARFFGKIFYRGKNLYREVKKSLKEMENELGLDELKDEFNRSIAEEKSKLEDDFTVIVDMEGNEHRVPNISILRKDLTPQELEEEIARENKNNKEKELNDKNILKSE